jgi:dienelactone hydrolase
MATPSLVKHVLGGALGEILVDVRAAPRDRATPAVVILHGFKGFKDWGMFPPFADRVARAGFTAVSYNASGSGVDDIGEFTLPDRFGRNTFSAELADLGAVLEALRSETLGVTAPSSVGLVGHSRGGGIAILRTARDQGVRALVTWAAISSVHRWGEEVVRCWRAAGMFEVTNQRTGQVIPLFTDILDDVERQADALDVEAHAARIGVPWLLIHGQADETVPTVEGRRLHAAAPASELLLIERTGHTFGAAHPFTGPSPALEQVFDATLRFLSAHLA